MPRKYYVVWHGRNPGVYTDWEDAREQVENYPDAKYKSFSSPEAAITAYRNGTPDASNESLGKLLVRGQMATHSKEADRLLTLDDVKTRFPEIDPDGWAVDASCLGNPGIMEYQCIDLRTGKRVFHFGPIDRATNNIGEFLAIVHALALMKQRGEWHTIYSDSRTAMSWVFKKHVKTTLVGEKANPKVTDLLARALKWLYENRYPVKILKWQTEIWGEVPADFGRKR